MKKLIIIQLITVTSIFSVQSQDNAMELALNEAMQKMDTATTLTTVMQASSTLNLAAQKWNEWITNYYAAFGKVLASYMEESEERKDLLLDDADKFISIVKTLKGDSCELLVLEAFIANARLSVKPKKRWKTYGKIFDEKLKSAKELNSDNPRIYYLQGVSLFYTPKMFGGGKKNALPLFEKAVELFKKEDASNILKPHWGNKQNTEYIKNCLED